MATLQDYLGITKLRDAWPKWKANVITVNNQVINHVAGTADKHAAQDITYTGDFVGKTEVKAAIDQAKTEIDTIVVNASVDPEVALARDSTVKGETFDTLDARLEESEQDLVSYKADNAINVRDYGAKTIAEDSEFNSTVSMQNAHDALGVGQTLLIPKGTYKVAGLNFYRDDITIECQGILMPFSDDCLPGGYCVMVGSPDKSVNYRVKGSLDVRSGNDWFTTTATGLLIMNMVACNMLINVSGFSVNVDVLGDGEGCAYNKIYTLQNIDGKISVRTRAINQGWANENIFFGGQYSQGTGKANYDGVVCFDIGDFDQFVSDSNHFIHPSVEGQGKLAIIRGQGHKIDEARIENVDGIYPDDYIHFMSSSNFNRVTFIYDTFSTYGWKELMTTGTRTGEGKLELGADVGDLTGYFDVGRFLYLIKDDDSKVDTMSAGASYSGEVTTITTIDDTIGLSIVGVGYLNYRNDGGYNVVDLYRKSKVSSGQPLNYNQAVQFSGRSEFPAIIMSDKNASSDIAWLANYMGITTGKLDFEGNLTVAKTANVRDVVLNGGNRIGRSDSVPTTGDNTRGDVMLKTLPTRGEVVGWVCSSSGTPGAWYPFGQVGYETGITGTPNFIGQIAVVAGVGYLAIGVASSADWKQITNA